MTADNVTPITGNDRVAKIAPITDDEAAEAVTVEPWPEVVPFDVAAPPEPFPTDALPPALARFVADTSTAMGADDDLVGASVLGAVSAVVGGRWIVPAPWRPSWREQLVLYVAAVAPPGSMKSAAMGAALAPLAELQRQLRERYGPEVAEAASARKIDEKRLAAYESQAANTENKGDAKTDPRLLAADLARDLESKPLPVVPRIYVTDATPEKVEALLGQHGERIAWLDSEGGIFTMLSGRYASKGGGVSIDIFLKGYSGDGVEVARMGRDDVELYSPALTVAITTQPAHLRAAITNVEGGKGRGLFDRFVYVWPKSAPVDRSQPTREVRAEVKAAYSQALHDLYGTAEKVPPGDRRVLDMDPDAADALQSFTRWVTEASKSGGVLDVDTLADWNSKLPGQVIRLAGMLTLIADPKAGSITIEAAAGAVRLGHYFASHARYTFLELDLDPEVVAARKCWEALTAESRRGKWKEWPAFVSTREVFEAVKGSTALGLDKADNVRAALTRLASDDYGLLRSIPKVTDKRGQPSERWEVHPDYRADT